MNTAVSFTPLAIGNDDAGLICGWLIAPHRDEPAQALDSAQAAEWLQVHRTHTQQAHERKPYLWLHFNLSHTQAERWIERHGQLPEEFFEALKEGSHSTRIELVHSALIAVMNDVRFDFSFDPSDIATLWVGVQPQLIVTARSKPLRSVDDLRLSIKNGAKPQSPTELLETLLRTQADVLVRMVRDMTQRVDEIEDELLSGKLKAKRAKLSNLRRVLVRLQRLLAPEPAALFRLLQRPPVWMHESDAQELRGASEEFSVVLRDMNTLQERIKLLQEEMAAHINEQTNRSLYVLTIVTVLALPINMTAGLFGMNVGGIPLANHPHGFLILVCVVAVFTAVAAWWAFRDK